MTTDIKQYMFTIFDMTVENIKQDENKNPSDELVEMIDNMVVQYKVTTEQREKQVKAIIEKGRAEELSDKQIRGLLETALRKHGISDRTIYRALPDELKDKRMQEIRSHRLEYVRKEDKSIDVPVPTPRPVPDYKPNLSTDGKIQSWDNTKVLAQQEEQRQTQADRPLLALDESEQSGKLRPAFVGTGIVTETDTDIQQDTDQPVYREPDRVAPVLGDKTLAQVLEDKNDVREQSYHRMNVPVPVPEADYTVTTQLQIHSGDSKFTVDVVAKCYPSKKTVELQPIDKSSIVKVR